MKLLVDVYERGPKEIKAIFRFEDAAWKTGDLFFTKEEWELFQAVLKFGAQYYEDDELEVYIEEHHGEGSGG